MLSGYRLYWWPAVQSGLWAVFSYQEPAKFSSPQISKQFLFETAWAEGRGAGGRDVLCVTSESWGFPLWFFPLTVEFGETGNCSVELKAQASPWQARLSSGVTGRLVFHRHISSVRQRFSGRQHFLLWHGQFPVKFRFCPLLSFTKQVAQMVKWMSSLKLKELALPSVNSTL